MHRNGVANRGLLALCAASIGWLSGCDGSGNGDISVDGRELEPVKLPRTIEHPDGTLELEFGDLWLRVPPEPRYRALTPNDPDTRTIFWSLEWPSLERWQSSGPPHVPEVRAAEVVVALHHAALDERNSDPIPVFRDPNWSASLWTQSLEGPFENVTLGLLEYRLPESGRPIIYMSQDEDLVGLNGQRPFVWCPGTGESRSGGYRLCFVEGHLSKQARYRYQFYDKWLNVWPELEGRIQRFLQDRIVGFNQ